MDNFDLKKYLAEGRLHEEVGSDKYKWWTKGNPNLKTSPVDLSTYNKHDRKIMNALRKGKTYTFHNHPLFNLDGPFTIKINWIDTKYFGGDVVLGDGIWRRGYDNMDFDFEEIESVKGNNIYHKGSKFKEKGK
jgi:hypothetical protein